MDFKAETTLNELHLLKFRKSEKLYDGNSTYCHNRDCARKVFRMRGCVASDEFIQQVYKTNKEKNTSSYGFSNMFAVT